MSEFGDTVVPNSENTHAKLSLTDLELVKTRFNALVDFVPFTQGLSNSDFARVANFVDEQSGKGRLAQCYKRMSGIWRLPNTLLYGSDILGPDLSSEFADLISEESQKQAFLEKADFWREGYKIIGRSLNAGDIEDAARNGLTEEKVFHAVPPDFNMGWSVTNKGVGTCLTFYDPSQMHNIGRQLYPAPNASAIEKVIILWPQAISLKN